MTVTSDNDNAEKTAEKKIPEVHAETHSDKFDQGNSADEMHEEQPSVSQKGFFSL